MKAKIIYIIDNLKVGGAQSHLAKLLPALADDGYQIKVVCLGSKDQAITSRLGSVFSLKMDCVWNVLFWFNFIRLTAFLRREKPDIVHTYLNTSNVFGVLASHLAGVERIFGSRRDLGHFRSGLIGKLETFSSRLCEKIVCVSQSVKDNAVKNENVSLEKCQVIYNGAQVSQAEKQPVVGPKKAFVVAMVAAMDRLSKGHLNFLQAAEKLLLLRQDVKFYLFGDGPLRSNLERLAYSNGLRKYVYFKGTSSDMLNDISQTDVLVVPSLSEGCSNALLEAMAQGIPVVATAVDGNLELIEEGVSGRLVPSQDPQALSKALNELLAEPLAFEKMGLEARERVKGKFSFEKMKQEYERLYHSVKDIRLAYIVTLFPCWSEVFIVNELRELINRGVSVDIFSLRKNLEHFTQADSSVLVNKTHYYSLPKVISASLFYLLTSPLAFMGLFLKLLFTKYTLKASRTKNISSFFISCYFSRIISKKKISHIHAHFANFPATAAMAISKFTSIPFSFTAHAHDIFLEYALLKEKTLKARSIVAVSEYNKAYLVRVSPRSKPKIKVIHCGVDITRLKPRQTEKPPTADIVSIGRLARMKGFKDLIRACEFIKEKARFTSHIIGEGPLRPELEELIAQAGLTGRVVLTGVLDNIKVLELLRQASIFVLASVWVEQEGQEGIPLALIEAMALGTPVIASRLSGIPELIDDNENGFMTEPGNAKELSEKMLTLMNDEALRTRFSNAAREKIEREFDIRKSVDSLIGLFS